MSLFPKIVGAVAKILPDREPDELAQAHQVIGKPISRLDGPVKVTGQARFAAEYAPPNLAHAALVFSTIAKGKIKAIETGPAEAAPGVLCVVTHKNAPKLRPAPYMDATGQTTNAGGTTVPILNTNQIFWNGQPVAVVVAETLAQAEYAASLIQVIYRPRTAKLAFEASKPSAKKPKDVLGEDTELKRGNADKALANAQFRVDAVYNTPRHNHAALEPHALVAEWSGNDVCIHTGSQYVRGTADTLAQVFSVKKEQVRVFSPFVGGGFGGKGVVWPHEQICLLAAKVVRRPVRLALSREGVFRAVGGRTCTQQRVALGANAEGKLLSLIHTGVAANSFSNDWPEQFTFPARHLYAMENYHICQHVLRLDMMANIAMRAPGESIGTFALESAIDELSYELGLDPVELRRRNEPERNPTKKTPFSSRNLNEAYRVGAERFGWNQRPAQPGTLRDGPWRIGQGCATAFYPVYRMPASARVSLYADGTARIQIAAHEMGMGTATAQTQIASERLGLPMHKIRFEYGDTSLPAGGMAGGSSQTISIAMAVDDAFQKVQKELLALARGTDSPLAGCSADDVHVRDEGLYSNHQPESGETYASLLARVGQDQVEAEVTSGAPLETLKYSMQSYGAQFCEVRVHQETGELRISRWLAVFDTGRIVNPKTALSQFQGGIIMGIGMSLMEDCLFDERNGRICNPSLAEYHVPVHADIPHIEVHFLDIPDPRTPLGAHGVGEIGITGTAAAVANAVFHATGKRVRDLPITLDKLM